MIQYRIQARKFSGNIIERKVGDGSWEPFLCCLVNKKESDVIMNDILNYLNEKQ